VAIIIIIIIIKESLGYVPLINSKFHVPIIMSQGHLLSAQ